MKSPNVYVGLYNDIRKGNVYSSIEEAAKEVRRVHPEGTVMQFAYLPEAERYWIAGTVGPAWDPRFNLIFADSSKADEHASKIRARGFPLSQIVCRELPILHAGPATVDIKTEAHYQVEKELDDLHKALSQGLPAINSQHAASLTLHEGKIGYDYLHFAMLDLDAAEWTRPKDFHQAVSALQNAAKLMAEIAYVDPETQPRKWERLQKAAHAFYGTPIFLGEAADGTPEGDIEDPNLPPSA